MGRMVTEGNAHGMTDENPLRGTGRGSFAAVAALGFPGSPPGSAKDRAEGPLGYEFARRFTAKWLVLFISLST